MAEIDELRTALDREYPSYDDHAGDWDGVLRLVTASPPRRSRLPLRLAVVGVAVVGILVLLVAPWKADTGIVERAQAAVGKGPVFHVVIRSQSSGRLVELATRRSRPVYDEQEIWWDPARGFHLVGRFGARRYADGLSRSRPRPDVPSGFVTGYREALDSGQAKVAGKDVVRGKKVTWLEIRTGGVTLEVAVDSENGDPVRIRYTPGGNAAVAEVHDVLRAESLPAGAGDFDVQPLPTRPLPLSGLGGSASRESRGVGVGVAQKILGQPPLWLGREHAGFPHEGFFRTWVQLGGRALRYTGVVASYGPVAVSERARLLPILRPDELKVWAATRPGFVLLYRSRFGFPRGTAGFLRRNGLYVTITAAKERAIVSAARALRPVSAGSGAGG